MRNKLKSLYQQGKRIIEVECVLLKYPARIGKLKLKYTYNPLDCEQSKRVEVSLLKKIYLSGSQIRLTDHVIAPRFYFEDVKDNSEIVAICEIVPYMHRVKGKEGKVEDFTLEVIEIKGAKGVYHD